mgnify:CR=1 FL=1
MATYASSIKTNMKPRLLRIATVPLSLHKLLDGQMNYLQQRGWEVHSCSAFGPEIEAIKSKGIIFHEVAMTRQITPWRDLLSLIALVRLMNKIRPTIVHTHTPKAGLLGMLASAFVRIPVRLHTVAGMPLMEATGVRAIILAMTEWITYFCAHRVYPNSHGLMRWMNDRFPRFKSKFLVIGNGSTNGIDVTYFSPSPSVLHAAHQLRKRYEWKNDTFIYLFVGRVVPDKGISELVQAFLSLRSQCQRPVKLLLVGPLETKLSPIPKKVMDIFREDADIRLVGYEEDVRPWLAVASVFVFPSYREGFPNVVMQASCMGVATIASDINGCNELLINGYSGWLVPVRSVDQLTNAMKLAQDDDNRSLMASRAQDWVRNRYAREIIWREIEREYSQQLEQRSRV